MGPSERRPGQHLFSLIYPYHTNESIISLFETPFPNDDGTVLAGNPRPQSRRCQAARRCAAAQPQGSPLLKSPR